MFNLLRSKLITKTTTVSEELEDWELVVKESLNQADDVTKGACVSRESVLALDDVTKGACESRESGLVLDDVTLFVKPAKEEENEVEKKGERELLYEVTRLVYANDELEDAEVEDDVDDDVEDDVDGGEEEDLMGWKLKGRFGKQNTLGKRGGNKVSTNKKLPCYYHTRPKSVLERRGKRLVW